MGAHGGSWTVPLSRLVPDGHVYALEAFPYYARALTLTLRMLRRRNATVLNFAVHDHAGPVQMVSRDATDVPLTGTIHLMGVREAVAESVEVPGTTLDALDTIFEFPTVDFIKLDIEGAELLALRGAERLLRKHRPTIFLELYDSYCGRYGYTAGDVLDFLASRGYRPHVVFSSSKIIRISPADYPGEGDVLFIPGDSQVADPECS